MLIVDDSALVRNLLTKILNSYNSIEVVGTAADPYIARALIKALDPDVITLDIQMPRMDGLTFLRNLMRLRPTPVVMISALTQRGAESTLRSLALGAVDFISKPEAGSAIGLESYAEEIFNKVVSASQVCFDPAEGIKKFGELDTDPDAQLCGTVASRKIVAIGASTGGTEAIKAVVHDLPESTPAIVITQHLPVAFSQSFSNHVDAVSGMSAHLAKEGQTVLQGNIYIAPGDRHLEIERQSGCFVCRLQNGPKVNRHKPSVDVMFDSLAASAGEDAIGILLSGMGKDGAQGMKKMFDAGATTIIQDQYSSVVWGMPGEAQKLNCVQHTVPLDQVASTILENI